MRLSECRRSRFSSRNGVPDCRIRLHRIAAIAAALVGAWLTIWFNRLDRRTRQLVSAGERPLALLEARFAEATKVSLLKIIVEIERPSAGAVQLVETAVRFLAVEFVAKKGDVWTCKKGIGEDLENVGSTVAIMRIIDLLPE